jgi:hypothetical protein
VVPPSLLENGATDGQGNWQPGMWRNWQTRTVQGRVGAIPWEFNSPHPHSIFKLKVAKSLLLEIINLKYYASTKEDS